MPRTSANAPVPSALSGCIACAPRPAQQRAGLLGLELSGEDRDRKDAAQPEARERDRMLRNTKQRREDRREDRGLVLDERREQASVGAAVPAERARRVLQRARRGGGPSAVKRMGERDRGASQRHPSGWVLAEERRRGEEGMNRGAEVVPEARQRELLGAAPAPRRLRPLVNRDFQPRARERQRGGEPVGARANNDRVGRARLGRSRALHA